MWLIDWFLYQNSKSQSQKPASPFVPFFLWSPNLFFLFHKPHASPHQVVISGISCCLHAKWPSVSESERRREELRVLHMARSRALKLTYKIFTKGQIRGGVSFSLAIEVNEHWVEVHQFVIMAWENTFIVKKLRENIRIGWKFETMECF